MAHTASKCALLILVLALGCLGCGGGSGLRSGVGGTAGGIDAGGGGSSAVDAAGSGGIGGGVGVTGGSAGNVTGGRRGTGGVGIGGSATGMTGVGGTGTGGAGTGAVATSGAGTGGARTGGARTGGVGTGGARTGGTGSGGTTGGGTGGTIAGAYLDLDSHSMDFGKLVLGKSSVATFTLTNRGTATSGVPVITTETARYPAGTPAPLTVTGCTAALPANASCTLTVSATPPEFGLFQAWVRIEAEPGTDYRLSISVVGQATGFEVVSPASVDFGVVPTGELRQHVITITAQIALTDLEVYTSSDDLSINASASTCSATLAAGASCVLTVDFLATTVGWKEGGVGVRVGGSMGYLAVVGFTANVSNATGLAIEPNTPQSFVAYFEETTLPIVFTVTNLSDAASGAITATIVGDYSWDFAISDTDCTSLAPHASCTFSVVCSPKMSASVAPREVVLSVTDGNTHLAVPLSAEVTFRM